MSESREEDQSNSESRRTSLEQQIRNDFRNWYKNNKNPETIFINEYRTAENTRVDLTGSEWQDGSEYEVKVWAAECKKSLNLRSFYGCLEQLRGYGKYFPELSLLVKETSHPDALRTVGEAMRIGIYSVDSSEEVTEISKPRTRLFDEEACLRTKSVATIQLVFGQINSNVTLINTSWGVYTGAKDQVQYNSSIDDYTSTCRIGVNVENLVRSNLVLRMDSRLQTLLVQLPSATRINLWRVFRFAKDRRSLLVNSCNPQDFDIERIRDLIQNHASQRNAHHYSSADQIREQSDSIQSFHFEVSLPIWKRYEILSRQQCQRRMQDAKDKLESVFDYLSSTS